MRIISIIVVLLAIAGARAAAQPAADPRKLYEEGLRHYDRAEYDDAIIAWTEAYRLTKAPLLLFNIGQAHRLDGDCAQARRFYADYRREAPSPKNADELAAAEALCPATTAPSGDAPVRAPAPPPAPAPASAPAAPAAAPPVPAPALVAPPSTHNRRPRNNPGRTRRIGGIALAGTGLALAVAGTWFATRAADASQTVEQTGGAWTPDLAALEDRGQRDSLLAISLGALGAAAIVTGTLLYVLGRRPSTPPLDFAPTADHQGATLTWRTAF
jgi:hypothetical protein